MINTIKQDITELAQAAGFDVVRFTLPTDLHENASHFDDFIKNEFHGEMKWMEEKADRRKDPLTLWPDTKSIIMLGKNYGPSTNPLDFLELKEYGNISVYALGKDYHDIVKKRLKQIAREVHRKYDAEVKVFVDTAPVMEKPLAEKSGLGWQGKHTNLVSNDFGSWLFIGSIFTTLDIEPDEKHSNQCGSCQSCLDICPTKAFPAPYKLDARKCISYLTIEYKGHIDKEFRKPMGNRIYGCDDCLSVCPWNKFAVRTDEKQFHSRIELDFPKLSDLAMLDDPTFRTVFSGSPIKRIGRDYFIRNVMIAIGNSDNKNFIPLLTDKLNEESPYIRAMAVWALNELCSEDQFMNFKEKHIGQECDDDVLAEWG
ncbi:tRNA epoxyqueuosine(34) reductase QueG [Pseudemcibacter aquimaris]|uniref:tRNA epoxyqueuosine(34) reductase QueG n=1 Tax=Pseudemcibacter aquimaris TaxID=2857064 RepID=UPI0020123152|nr:tRNA epoxyqueuosine(34) reductase QueG [Pseudemcibacter aquimaris]MCC3861472.1 tRNA epoxyqueuosine(34) reductase QueG [Pseudemcibacter aquimaris]WDU58241.1 tRNA epoxyqueuosine(34) reductase QueG [Pseudemcibacter aquimaris]